MARPGRRFDRSDAARSTSDGARTPDTYFPTLDAATALDDPVLAALDALDDALATANAGTARMRRRLATLREERVAGRGYGEIVAAEPAPRLVEMLSHATRDLDAAGAAVRRAAARALHDEGMTMDEIATFFGVSRQRVSALLRGR